MSNFSLPPPSPCGSWPWVIVHTFPHSPCLFVSLFPSMWRGFFLPSFSGGCATGKLDRITSLQWLIHQHLRAPFHTTLSTDTAAHLTTSRLVQRSPRPVWLCLSLLTCLYRFSFCISLFYIVTLSRCPFVNTFLPHLPFYSLSLFRSTFSACQCLSFAIPPAFLRLFFSLSLGTQLQCQNTEGHRALPPLSAF